MQDMKCFITLIEFRAKWEFGYNINTMTYWVCLSTSKVKVDYLRVNIVHLTVKIDVDYLFEFKQKVHIRSQR